MQEMPCACPVLFHRRKTLATSLKSAVDGGRRPHMQYAVPHTSTQPIAFPFFSFPSFPSCSHTFIENAQHHAICFDFFGLAYRGLNTRGVRLAITILSTLRVLSMRMFPCSSVQSIVCSRGNKGLFPFLIDPKGFTFKAQLLRTTSYFA